MRIRFLYSSHTLIGCRKPVPIRGRSFCSDIKRVDKLGCSPSGRSSAIFPQSVRSWHREGTASGVPYVLALAPGFSR